MKHVSTTATRALPDAPRFVDGLKSTRIRVAGGVGTTPAA
jgi:hypothetical protein